MSEESEENFFHNEKHPLCLGQDMDLFQSFDCITPLREFIPLVSVLCGVC